MESQISPDFRNVRARAQSVRGDVMVGCWIEVLTDSTISFLADAACSLKKGDKVLLSIDGEGATIMIGEITNVKPRDSWLRYEAVLTQDPLAMTAKSEQRLLATKLEGHLCCLEYEDAVKVLDVSLQGVGIVCKRALPKGEIVSIDLSRGSQSVRVRGTVRYSIAIDGGEFRCGIQLLASHGIDKASLRWLAQSG